MPVDEARDTNVERTAKLIVQRNFVQQFIFSCPVIYNIYEISVDSDLNSSIRRRSVRNGYWHGSSLIILFQRRLTFIRFYRKIVINSQVIGNIIDILIHAKYKIIKLIFIAEYLNVIIFFEH